MAPRRLGGRRRAVRRLLLAVALIGGAIALTGQPAGAATTASFSGSVLTVFGDADANQITVSRDAAGAILVNGGAVPITGGTPTVANTQLIQVFGLGGADSIKLDEAGGALPRANLFGGTDADVITGGSGGDMLFGQSGPDRLLGRGGADVAFGGTEDDQLTGGDADDQSFGEAGNDVMVWNPGDDTDLNEGGAGTDVVLVLGGGGAEVFAATANGARVRFDRLDPAPFAIDIGTSELLLLGAGGGDDRFSATGNLAALIGIAVSGGTGDDTILGSNGADWLVGDLGDDLVDGQQGNDWAHLGPDDDVFQWDPGDGSDTIEGGDGTDTMLFNGSAGNEQLAASPNGARLRFTRDLGNIVMDTDGVEVVDLHAQGGVDTLTVEDLSGTDVVRVAADLSSPLGGGDGAADTVVVRGTGADDVALVTGDATETQVVGLAALVTVTGAEAANDRLVVEVLAGNDVVDASTIPTGAVLLTLDGGDGDDVLLGGDGGDVLLGGPGDDVLLGGGGLDVIDGGDGDDVEIQSLVVADVVVSASPADAGWAEDHVEVVDGETVVDVGDHQLPVPAADASLFDPSS